MQNMAQEFFTIDELAGYLRLLDDDGEPDRRRVYWMRQRGQAPPAHRIGGSRGRLLFRRSDVEEWLASRAEPTAQAS
ncbi:MAG TPA: helix-turn-helix domain-containing protein [Streptosporangiaceae bacterium]|jgi:hypothetical protein|nr:helix-turn-helix domain-containing protein [Streptosporangiaceae bacterium]